LDLVINTPDEFGALIRSEVVRWSKVVRDAQIKPAD
jgi:tripartite-type tricarboxylate transporter receptor subunit TctC